MRKKSLYNGTDLLHIAVSRIGNGFASPYIIQGARAIVCRAPYSCYDLMKAKYFSYAQACAICKDFLHLQGEPLDDQHQIRTVAVAPYSRILQWQFLQELLKNDWKRSNTQINNPSGQYDVLLVAPSGNEQGFVAHPLRNYVAARNIPFDESRYHCLRSHDIPMHVLKQILS